MVDPPIVASGIGFAYGKPVVHDFSITGNRTTSHWVGGKGQTAPPENPGGQGETPPAAPEPSAIALCGFGLGGVAVAGIVRRRRK